MATAKNDRVNFNFLQLLMILSLWLTAVMLPFWFLFECAKSISPFVGWVGENEHGGAKQVT